MKFLNKKVIAILFSVAAAVSFYFWHQDADPAETARNLSGRVFERSDQSQLSSPDQLETEKITPQDLDYTPLEDFSTEGTDRWENFSEKTKSQLEEGKIKGEELSSAVSEEVSKRKENLIENFKDRIRERACEEINSENN